MFYYKKEIFLVSLVFFSLLTPFNKVLAHQPKIVDNLMTEIINPEISQAFYGELTGEPHFFKIKTDKPFSLYVNILMPDIYGEKEAVSADIFKDIDGKQNKIFVSLLDGNLSSWRPFYEPFGGDSYWQGPEFKKNAERGIYTIRVFGLNNKGKYVLAIGEKEEFKIKDLVKTIKILPQLKTNYFNKHWSTAFLNYTGLFLLIVFVLSFVVAIVLTLFIKWVFKILKIKLFK